MVMEVSRDGVCWTELRILGSVLNLQAHTLKFVQNVPVTIALSFEQRRVQFRTLSWVEKFCGLGVQVRP